MQKKSFDSNGFLSEEQDSQTPNAIFQQRFSNVCNKNNKSFYTMIHALKMTWYMPVFIACLLVSQLKPLICLLGNFIELKYSWHWQTLSPHWFLTRRQFFPTWGKCFFPLLFSPSIKRYYTSQNNLSLFSCGVTQGSLLGPLPLNLYMLHLASIDSKHNVHF